MRMCLDTGLHAVNAGILLHGAHGLGKLEGVDSVAGGCVARPTTSSANRSDACPAPVASAKALSFPVQRLLATPVFYT